MSDQYISLRAFCLHRRSFCGRSGSAPEEREIYGDALLDSALVLDAAGREEPPVRVAGLPKGSSFEVQLIFKLQLTRTADGSDSMPAAVMHFHDHDDGLRTFLTLELEPSAFARMWAAAPEIRQLNIGASWAGEAGEPFLRDTDHGGLVHRPLDIYTLWYQTTCSMDSDWIESRRSRSAMVTLSDVFIGTQWFGQAKVICEELAKGISADPDETRRKNRIRKAAEMIEQARQAFREPQPEGLGDKHHPNVFDLRREPFVECIRGLDEERQKDLKLQYDTFWRHFNLTAVVRAGQDKAGPSAYGLRCRQDELEPVAQMYLEVGAVSPMFEWMLLDALIFGECLGTAQLLLSDQKMFGVRVASPLKPHSSAAQLRNDLWASAKGLLFEGLKLATTALLAWAATGGIETSFWVVMTGVSVARWVSRAVNPAGNAPQARAAALLGKMEQVCELLRQPSFNARVLRQRLYEVMAEGAGFSMVVLNILDRRIAAEEMSALRRESAEAA